MDLDKLQDEDREMDECYLNVKQTVKVIGGKWKVLILWHITSGPTRFNELRRLIPEISQKMLTQQLRELESDGLVNRKIYPEIPPRVEYTLTPYGETLESIFDVLYDWGKNHRKRLKESNSNSNKKSS